MYHTHEADVLPPYDPGKRRGRTLGAVNRRPVSSFAFSNAREGEDRMEW